MATITLKGNPVHTSGDLPAVGSKAPAFTLTDADFGDVRLDLFAGKKKVINIVGSLDTSVCAISAKRFNEEVGSSRETVLINVSADLPPAQKRFCEAEHLEHMVNLSTFRSPEFGTDYGVKMVDGPRAGLMSRAVLVLDAEDTVVHAQQVPEFAQEPDYHAALTALRSR